MERLTVNDLNKVCYDPWELCGMDSYCTKKCHEEGGCNKDCHILKMYHKLAYYEDLLSYMVGDVLYRINKGAAEPIIPMQIIGVAIRNENELVIQTKDIYDNGEHLYKNTSIGKTVFLTKEEAKQALKECE